MFISLGIKNLATELTVERNLFNSYFLEPKKYEKLIISHCNFLFTNYTNIFNRLMKDELNFQVFVVIHPCLHNADFSYSFFSC